MNTAEALNSLHAAGLVVDSIEWDGALHRVPVADKPRGRDGAYIAHADAPASVWWQNWRSGESGVWTAQKRDSLTPTEREALKRRMEANRKAREAEETCRHAEAAEKAARIYAAATERGGHPYLTAKGVKPFSGLKVTPDGRLVVPVRSEQGELTGLQFIGPDGEKKFLTGTAKKGCFFPIGKDAARPLLIAEGLATGLSLHKCTGNPCLVAFDSGNLLPVAELARRLYPEREIILCSDNDCETDGNPGVTKATAAALAVGGSLAVPRHEGRTVDWNDLHKLLGAGEVRAQVMAARKPEQQEQGESPSAREERLPAGFVFRPGGSQPGLWHIESKDDGEPVETWLAGPFEILGETRNQESSAWGLYLRWLDADGNAHAWAMARALLAGRDASAWRCVLADGGLRIATTTKARGLLSSYFDGFRTGRRVLCVERTGWHRDGAAFVLPDETIFPATTQNEVGIVGIVGMPYSRNGLSDTDFKKCKSVWSVSEQIVLQSQTASNPFLVAGTLAGWQSTIGEWSRGNSRLMLALCAGFAAPLLFVSGEESGGYNFVGKTSSGKTTALVAAGSAWGKGSSSGGYVQSWRATSNGLEGDAALHSDALLCLDELGQATATTASAAAYMLGNGSGKSRMKADGTARAVKSWRVMFLSTGEIGLEDKIAEENKARVKAGQLVRLVDIPADAGAGLGLFESLHGHTSAQAFADAIKSAAAINYGHAARAFIRAFLDNRNHAENMLKTRMRDGLADICHAGADSEVRRVAKRFLLCSIAGELASAWGLLPWENGEALAAVKKCFDAWLEHRGGAGAAEDTAIMEKATLFIEQHGASRFQDIGNPDAVCINRAGFRRIEGNSTIYYVMRQMFKEMCCGFEPKRAARVLRDKGILLADPDGKNLARQVVLPGLGKQRCFTLRLPDIDLIPTIPTCEKSGRYSESVDTVGYTDHTDHTDLKNGSGENNSDRVLI
jgi:putative DNA primase/helicase